ncbi:lysophospholipid acyltransferase family protein [Vagococcus carniphilus]|uniref:1-acyl-sn-glycerol-3-phosphate acyltransferase n=1 Tax=Vagococcus carniphilus TaxID=218144 RepID=A0A430B3W1_9ENTE|nr:1-acyl-sn-glycerol-3-phosphate acyltransferase [Vagococcus carniphilus]MDT2813513.1 1-acyl-sn-glycerol-3-phosphate acyltransferase [Vagococcus carniphilus]MDT2829984.1 1-acyl-sn-glycerol-3-phosphate acyltransferase [Vagococcus carniphilus]MDT2833918.1 1-acyl-sn-glycerol-3-phosphate acyltransferase [Vagococcus carniphilus]MDT2838419.1 1-acyl-sn-glycerol-3-phosphate acyltransferase [Vagococcus carniphilus]MDT2850350.1 1-acyl-sn-glycerol-3-phosphate acyltransferase [Vagococcus carniphilus]
MMYRFLLAVVRFLTFFINTNARYIGRDNLPKEENYVLVGPHRTWYEPLYFAMGAWPKKFSFMAKKELFDNPILGFILKKCHVFPVDRENPGPSAIKTPVKALKNTDLSVMVFPSGSRYSDDLKGGAAVIAKMAKVKIVPAVYQGPVKFSRLWTKRRVTLAFGEPIDISDIKKLDKEGIAEVERRMQKAFKELDNQINPDFVYVKPEKKEKK